MEAGKTRVLVVDDDPDLLTAHSLHLLSLGCDVLSAENGERGLELVQKSPESIDVILADIVMPVMDGYQLCQAVKNDSATQEIPLIFISQLSSLEEKMKGFEVGADDYITKPISPEELGYKINTLLKLRLQGKDLKQQLNESNSVAMQAMTYSSVLGQILEFYKNALNAVDFEEVARLLFEVTNGYGLKCTLQIITHNGLFNFGSQGVVSPLEANVIEMSRLKGRFFDFGARTLINYDDFSLLIKNMPLDQPERYGILKDSLGALCNAVEARVKFLLQQNASRQKEQIVDAVLSMMEDVDRIFSEVQHENVSIINHMIDEIDNVMMDLALTENQEELVRAILVDGREQSSEIFKSGEKLYDKFEQVRDQLDTALSK